MAGGSDTINGIPASSTNVSWDYKQFNTFQGTVYSFQRGLLGPYVKTDKVIQCPTAAKYDMPVANVPETYGIALLGVDKYSGMLNITRMTQSSETVIFADAIEYTNSSNGPTPYGLSRPTEIFPPSNYATNYGDCFQGRHGGKQGIGNVGFYDGHVSSVVVQVRTGPTYVSGIVPAPVKVLHIGPLYCKAIDYSQIQSNSDYQTACTNQLNYYYWINKQTKSISP